MPRCLSATCSAPGTRFYPTSVAIRACSSTPAASRQSTVRAYSPSTSQAATSSTSPRGFAGRKRRRPRVGVTRALGLMARKFTMGANIEAAARAPACGDGNPNDHPFDMLGEGARTYEDSARYLASYAHAARDPGGRFRLAQMSVKLSSLSPRFDELSRRVRPGSVLQARVAPVADGPNAFTVFVDAEEQNRLELTLSVVENVIRSARLAYWGRRAGVRSRWKPWSTCASWL